ncbi:hypothetical protein HN51_037453 [Arachis hypogaea]
MGLEEKRRSLMLQRRRELRAASSFIGGQSNMQRNTRSRAGAVGSGCNAARPKVALAMVSVFEDQQSWLRDGKWLREQSWLTLAGRKLRRKLEV